ncbi:hypothetical protein GLA29479_4396 [Lysobacter antibioticus]|uniref:Uncharacterized protein n=1 Tax=Lysobacter antibioticus TaxID=84531 RepID=A0A0S2E399_LYSAN|nr:hypothetical protein GLA29479_4396 [Lysobacter antibioticus]ALN78681.1 hypothetical protein LA76x_0520 [Lysobacter antibioticus]
MAALPIAASGRFEAEFARELPAKGVRTRCRPLPARQPLSIERAPKVIRLACRLSIRG